MKIETAIKYFIIATTVVVFLFTTFKTKVDSEKETTEIRGHFERRLDRIEDKLDRVIEHR